MPQIKAGTRITFDVIGTVVSTFYPLTTSAAQAQSKVAATLAQRMEVISGPAITPIDNPALGLGSWRYKATVTAAPLHTFEDIATVDWIVRNAFADATNGEASARARGYEAPLDEPGTGPGLFDGFLAFLSGLGVGGVLAIVVIGGLIFYKKI